MATKIAKRPIRRKAVVKKIKTQQSPAAAVTAAYELAERFVETQRDLLRGLIENLTEQFARHAPKHVTVTKAVRAHRATRKHVAVRRPAKHAV
ncbi:MAG TPA: hypothetical protein VET26_11300 [Candidatus Sulfotelmatobacter sp.]|nr:hypothetical protein [Candidatus Sulfotelmatobacter sp.]